MSASNDAGREFDEDVRDRAPDFNISLEVFLHENYHIILLGSSQEQIWKKNIYNLPNTRRWWLKATLSQPVDMVRKFPWKNNNISIEVRVGVGTAEDENFKLGAVEPNSKHDMMGTDILNTRKDHILKRKCKPKKQGLCWKNHKHAHL